MLTWQQTQYFLNNNFGPGGDDTHSSIRKPQPAAHVENYERLESELESEHSESRSKDQLLDRSADDVISDDDQEADYENNKDGNEHDEIEGGRVGKADFHEPQDGTIQSISLLGERNSGTRWIYGYVVFFF